MSCSKLAVAAITLTGGADALLRLRGDNAMCSTLTVLTGLDADIDDGAAADCTTDDLAFRKWSLCTTTGSKAATGVTPLPTACKAACCSPKALTVDSAKNICKAQGDAARVWVGAGKLAASTGAFETAMECSAITGITMAKGTAADTVTEILLKCCPPPPAASTGDTNTATNSTTSSPAGSSCR